MAAAIVMRSSTLTIIKDGLGNVQYAYDRDEKGRIGTFTVHGVVRNFLYDADDEITKGPTASYGYDANFNRTNGSASIGYDNRLKSSGGWNYKYDKNGNLTDKYNFNIKTNAYPQGTGQIRIHYRYDVRNRLTKGLGIEFDSSAGVQNLSGRTTSPTLCPQ